MPEVRAHIESIAHHDSGVRLITLSLRDPFPFYAGQYLHVVHPSRVRVPMSIASAPDHLPRLELHYRALPGVADAALMDELLDGRQDLSIDGPDGAVRFDGRHTAELLLIAGGSGISQCRAIVDHLHRCGQSDPVRLVWSVTQPNQLYCDAELRAFAPWLDYLGVVDVPNAENAAITWLRGHNAAKIRKSRRQRQSGVRLRSRGCAADHRSWQCNGRIGRVQLRAALTSPAVVSGNGSFGN